MSDENRYLASQDINEKNNAHLLTEQLRAVIPVLEAEFYRKMEEAGVFPDVNQTHQEAFAQAVTEGVKDYVPLGRDLASSIISKMDGVMEQIKHNVQVDHERHRLLTEEHVSAIVESTEFQDGLRAQIDQIKLGAMRNVDQALKDKFADMAAKSQQFVDAAQNGGLTIPNDLQRLRYVKYYSGLNDLQRGAAMESIQQAEETGALSEDQRLIKEVLVELNGGADGKRASLPQPSISGPPL